MPKKDSRNSQVSTSVENGPIYKITGSFDSQRGSSFQGKEMSFNSSHLPDISCFSVLPNVSTEGSVLYQVTIATCVVTLLLAPMTAAGNAFILAAIWRNPALRKPSFVLLAGLAFTDFCTGIITQPFYASRRISDEIVNRKKNFIAGIVSDGFAYYFSSLTVIVMTLMAVERWLYMSRRSLLTIRRVSVIYIGFSLLALPITAGSMYTRLYRNQVFRVIGVIFFLLGAFCVALTASAYFKVFQIIRRHQNQIHTNQTAIDLEKYRRSFFTILYILAIFVLSYSPYLCIIVVFPAIKNCGVSYYATMNFCVVIVFSSSFLNPLLYYWRIKEIRDGVKSIMAKIICKLTPISDRSDGMNMYEK